MKTDNLRARVIAYAKLARVTRPIGTLLLLWPTLWALWISAEGSPQAGIVCIFVLGVVFMRAAGCVINDYADRNIDGHVSRTVTRPLATGEVSSKEALILFLCLSLTSFALVLFLNTLTITLSFVAIVLAASYPFMKRVTHLPQVHLGLAFGWAVPMSFAAQTNGVPVIAWLMLAAVVCWAVAYDTMYAMVDRDDDIKIGVKSTAILFASSDRTWIGVFQIMVFVILTIVGQHAALGFWYYVGLVVAAGFALYHQYLIRNREPRLCFKAFLNNNYLGLSIFAGILMHYSSVS
jgi:4-hydroxybenzoate polyprenyltransferase